MKKRRNSRPFAKRSSAVADASEPETNHFAWTDFRKKYGLDPLGMQNSSVNCCSARRLDADRRDNMLVRLDFPGSCDGAEQYRY